MAVPKRRHSHARKGKRRSHQHVKMRQYTYCDRCHEPTPHHLLCENCGWSNSQNRELVPMEKKEG